MESVVRTRRGLNNLHRPDLLLKTTVWVLVEAALLWPDVVPNLTPVRKCAPEAVSACITAVSKDAGVAKEGLKHVFNGGRVICGCLLVGTKVGVIVFPHLSGGAGLPAVEETEWQEPGVLVQESVVCHHR